ncbi:serine acetyltransferase [Apibacter muscae]|uniref:Serine acetyltransferase n=1 Tax=Apibacter muscae TaxID=2509004 RepID=A0A563D7H0_9FLAO|nr:serine O-acetyltransferase EpsC [Apibacter muscae]TWP26037.1 serine acetyltransferase [Apibacter muscae]TWP27888.1 serine acetyltransferase [Apibacter muscae]
MNKKIDNYIDLISSHPICLSINKKDLETAVDLFFSQMYPICEKTENLDTKRIQITTIYKILSDNISKLLNSKSKADEIIDQFFQKLPEIQDLLYKDAQAFLDHDPAAESLEEVVITYPGFYALTIHRIAHEFYKLNVPIIPRLFSEYAHSKVGVDIHPGAQIGERFFLDHGTGTVIGETTSIGNNVKIYQGVTLGALYVTKNLTKTKRHPTVEDNVVIYAGATILGGETTIGHDSTIGGNVWITNSIQPYTLVYYSSQMKLKTIKEFKEPINYVI